MRPTIEEIKAGFKKCGLKPVQGAFRCDGGCCGLSAYAAHLGFPVLYMDVEAIQHVMEGRLGYHFTNGFIEGWDEHSWDTESIYIETNEGYKLGRQAWEACK